MRFVGAFLMAVLFLSSCSQPKDESSQCAHAGSVLIDPADFSEGSPDFSAESDNFVLLVSFKPSDFANHFGSFENQDFETLADLEIRYVFRKKPDMAMVFNTEEARDRALCWFLESAPTSEWKITDAVTAQVVPTS